MDKNIPSPGELYKNIEGNICQIVCIAIDYNSKEREVVYQEMFQPFAIWAEPLGNFMEKETALSYGGNVKTTLNTKSDAKEMAVKSTGSTISNDASGSNVMYNNSTDKEGQAGAVTDSALREALLNGTVERKIEGKIPDSEIAERSFMELLDARTYHDKYIIFSSMKKYMNKHILNNIAVALDIVLEEGELEEQYESVKRCLQTFEHYEICRLR